MALESWIGAHSPGWPIFLPTSVALSVLAAIAYARGKQNRIAWLWLAVWLAGIAAFYVITHLDRYRASWPRMWGAQLLTIAVTVAVPLFAVVVVLALWARRRVSGHWTLGASLAAVAGVLTILLTGSISLGLFEWLRPWIMVGRQ